MRTLSLLLILAVVAAASGCERTEPSPPATTTAPTPTASAPATRSATQEPAPPMGETWVFASPDGVKIARAATEARLQRLQNLVVEWDATTEYIPPPELVDVGPVRLTDGSIAIVKKGSLFQHNTFSLFDGRSRYDFCLAGDSLKQAIAGSEKLPQVFIRTYSPTRVEQLQLNANEKRHLGSISNKENLPAAVVDVALGLRGYGSNQWLGIQELKAAAITDLGDGRFLIEHSDHQTGYINKWTVDEKVGFAITEFESRAPGARTPLCSIVCENFEAVNDFPLPRNISYRRISSRHVEGQESRDFERTTIRVTKYQLGAADNTSDRYLIVWPANTILHDTRVGKSFNVGNASKKVSDADISKSLSAERGPKP